MHLDLSGQETAALSQELHDIVESDRYPFLLRIRTLRGILAELRPEPVRQPLPRHWGALQPAPYARVVATVDSTELALEIGFLAGHNAVADDERKGHHHHQQPEIVERDGQAD
jgi:hypothetical protein